MNRVGNLPQEYLDLRRTYNKVRPSSNTRPNVSLLRICANKASFGQVSDLSSSVRVSHVLLCQVVCHRIPSFLQALFWFCQALNKSASTCSAPA